MKSDKPVITLLGNNSGRNLGDAAIMSSILESLTKELPDAEFLVPSIKPKWIEEHYGNDYNVKAIDVMPWTFSIRLLGIPTLNCLRKSDVALICDGIIFGIKLFNPAFNYLITLIFLVPFAKLWNCKLVCYSCGVGPFYSKLSRIFARYLIQNCDLVIMRENDSKALCQEIGVTKEISVTGDAAFINPVSSKERAAEILKEEGINPDKPIFGVNVTSYLDSWLKPEEGVSSKEEYLCSIEDGVNKAKELCNDEFQVVLFSTHPMDEEFSYRVAAKVNGKVIHNSKYLSHDIQAVMRECELFIGMRFHSLVLASAVAAPIIGLIYAPKVKGYMRLLDCEKYSIELADVRADSLANSISSAWKERKELQKKQQTVIDGLREGAHRAAKQVREVYYPEMSEGSRKTANS